jgi:3-deoxy-manno-octulosonate cytidylyltransferase (CMP-KDO synthetase)
VVEQVHKASRLERVLVATDDDRIVEAANAAGAEAVLTRADHPSGTDRIAEAIAGTDADVVVNIQGDEPLIDPDLIDSLVDVLAQDQDQDWDMATAATPIEGEAELQKPSIVKVVSDASGRALYFSRSVIPHLRDPDRRPEGTLHWRHLGIYAYRRSFLERLVQTPVCDTERAESLEQLRALHIGARIRVVETNERGIGVDTPEDVKYVESIIREREQDQG